MRRDLVRVCIECRTRQPAADACARCGGPLRTARDGLMLIAVPVVGIGRTARIAKWAIALPSIPIAIATVVLPVAILAPTPLGWNAPGVAMTIGGGLALALAPTLVAGLPWAVWTGLVLLGRWLASRGSKPVAGTVVDALRAGTRGHQPAPDSPGTAGSGPQPGLPDLLKRWGSRRVLAIALLLLALQLLAESGASPEQKIFQGTGPRALGEGLLSLLLLDALFIVLPFAMFTAFVNGVAWYWSWLRLPPDLFRRAAPDRADLLGARLEELTQDRACATGVAESLERTLIAPASGRDCLAFRLTGTVNGHQVDDADAADFVVVADDGTRTVVRTDDVIVDLEPGAPRSFEKSAALDAFLAARGLGSSSDEPELAEARLSPGATVTIWGDASDEPDPDAGGYRERDRRQVLRGSAAPLVIRAGRD